MDLKEFIKTALVDITDAVSELQQELQNIQKLIRALKI